MVDDTPVESRSDGVSYRDAGVDIDAGNEVVSRIRNAVQSTQDDRVLAGSHGAFGGFFRLLDGAGKLFGNELKDPILVGATDGVGTKLKVAFECNKLDTVGIDLVAMCVNDLVVGGARPLFFLDYVATGKISPEAIAVVVEGIAEGCRQSGCALLGGETAEMPGFYQPGELDLAGFSVGVVEKDEILDGKSVAVGDRVLGLASHGVHSNGFSLVRRVLMEGDGALPLDQDPSNWGHTLGEELLRPTKIYVRSILDVLAGAPGGIHALAHITGGGLLENIPRVLPSGMGAVLQRSAWDRPDIFALIEDRGPVVTEEMDRVFNQGIGMVVIVDQQRGDEILKRFRDLGETAWEIGEVVAGDGIQINS
ncbi:MAG: phosphoribosylformylglycinamidine cyclo-ligase [Planctomycetia bacterium TMED53]|nr:MAG: phosphoribosylformylglycinamidine cyclo-ligase [Planctomycetia bacterium TMED53]